MLHFTPNPQGARGRLMLTGTPLQNDLIELNNLLTFLLPNVFAGQGMGAPPAPPRGGLGRSRAGSQARERADERRPTRRWRRAC
jgi:hypothetical protein